MIDVIRRQIDVILLNPLSVFAGVFLDGFMSWLSAEEQPLIEF